MYIPKTRDRPMVDECSAAWSWSPSGFAVDFGSSVAIGRISLYNARMPSGMITVSAVPTSSPAPNTVTILSFSCVKKTLKTSY